MSDLDYLLVTNGHGEDAIAALLAAELAGRTLAGLPLVGAGEAFRAAGVPVLGPAVPDPSGGWGLRSAAWLAADLRAGWTTRLLACARAARQARARLVVGVGDVLPVAFAAACGLGSAVLVGCNKSDFYTGWGESYLAIEIAALRVWDAEILARDRRTADRLARLGLRARFLGNAMADLAGSLPPPGDGIALLPGSRADARGNLPLMLEAVRHLGRDGRDPEVRVALAAGFEDLAEDARRAGATPCGLAEALAEAGVAIATAGTASEVAAAHGRPVIAFPGPGPQYTPAFARRQKDLLGPALILCDRDPREVGAAARRALDDEGLRAEAAAAGRERVGAPGAARAIASHLEARLAAR